MKSLFYLFFFCGMVFSVEAQYRKTYRPSAKALDPKAYQLEIKTVFRTTESYYDIDGNKASLAEGDSYSLIDGELSLDYGIGRNLVAGLGVRGRQVSSKHTYGSKSFTPTASGVESFSGFFKYSFFPKKGFQWALDFLYRQTVYENENFTDSSVVPDNELVLGDSGPEYAFGMHLNYKRKRDHFLSSLVRYKVPGNDLSQEITYRFESAWLWRRAALILGLQGIKSLNGDAFSGDPQNKPFQSVGATGRFNSINREVMEPFIGINWSFKSWRLDFEGGQSISGRSTDHGSFASLSLNYISSGITTENVKIAAFKEYIIDSTVIKVSPRGKFIKIDQGLSSDVEKGMRFDIFKTDFFGENILVATGVAYEVKADTAIIKVVKKYKNLSVKKGFAARGY